MGARADLGSNISRWAKPFRQLVTTRTCPLLHVYLTHQDMAAFGYSDGSGRDQAPSKVTRL
jgi:hypothetical protein